VATDERGLPQPRREGVGSCPLVAGVLRANGWARKPVLKGVRWNVLGGRSYRLGDLFQTRGFVWVYSSAQREV
jgi:hypothetical protein